MIRRSLPIVLVCAVLLPLAPRSLVPRAEAGLPTPTVHRTEKSDAATLDLRRRAPKSLFYLFGESPQEQDAETEEGGDGGGEPGGEGTGEALQGQPDIGDIVPIDLSGDDVFSRISSFNALDLEDPQLPGRATARRSNQALTFSVPPNAPGFATAPGYGNNWDQLVVWSRPVPNPSAPVTVRVRFVVNHDLEPGHDVFRLEVRREPGGWEVVRELTGLNTAPTGGPGPAVVDETFSLVPGEFTGGTAVDLRLRVLTDRTGSDEDGLWPSDGAAQVDLIRVWFDGTLVSSADFEGAPPNADGWTPQRSDFAGDFLKLLELTEDLDPCRRNVTFQFTFVDDGTPPSNDPTGTGTGGARSSNWTYGPGGFVVNYEGGISEEGTPLHNALRTPAFAWDLPGPDDDGATGGLLLFSVWKHLPLENGIFYFWRVRSFDAAQGWSPWRDFDEVYYEPSAPHYERVQVDVSSLIVADPDSAQFELGVVDLADALGLPGTDATPSPTFDNIGFAKFALDGPAIRIADADRFHSAFPSSGTADFGQDLAGHAIRVDAARDVDPGPAIVPGDSMVVRVKPALPGVPLATPPRLVWALRANPRYDAVRFVPPAATVVGTVDVCGDDWTVRTGSIDGQPVVTSTGQPIDGLWSFDLPDGPPNAPWHGSEPSFLFPGDALRWFVEAQDALGNTATAPEDTTGFFALGATTLGADRGDLVLGLPTLRDDTSGFTQPSVLVVDDTGSLARGAVIADAFAQIGRAAGCAFDLYRVGAAGAGLSNGIGAATGHGANAAQLAGYDTIVHFAGAQGAYLLSDGTGDPLDDDGDDLGTLLQWRQQNGPRRTIHFGDDLVSGLLGASAVGATYVTQALGVELQGPDVRAVVDGQTAPGVQPISTSFATSFVAGGCLATDQFDAIVPRAGTTAVRTHRFLDPQGQGSYDVAAVVWHARTTTNGPRVDVTVPISFASILDPGLPRRDGTARAALLEELLTNLDGPIGTDAPVVAARQVRLDTPFPNPFNPRTSVSFALPRGTDVRLRVVDLAGRHVATLIDGALDAGTHRVAWNGTDDRGAAVASGVYLVDLRADGTVHRRKVALVR